jgi:large subunit ribosomal protein L24
MNLKVGDKVVIISGKEKGKEGKIVKTLKDENKVIVEGVNVIKRHTKPKGNDQKGGIIEKEAAINASNVMIIDPKTKKATRIGYSVDKKGNKIRISKKSNENLD